MLPLPRRQHTAPRPQLRALVDEAMAAPSDAELIAALEGMITPESVDALSMKKVMKQL